MKATSKLTRKYQTTIPKPVVEALGIKPSDWIVYDIEDGLVILRARTGRLADLAGRFAAFGRKPRRPRSIREINEAIAAAAAESGRAGLARPHEVKRRGSDTEGRIRP